MADTFLNIPNSGSPSWKDPVETVVNLPSIGNTIGDSRIVKSTNIIYIWTGLNWVAATGGGGGAVTSVNGQVGNVVLTTDDVASTSTNGYVPVNTLTPFNMVGVNSAATDIIPVPGITHNNITGGLYLQFDKDFNGSSGGVFQNLSEVRLIPGVNSPNQNVNVNNTQAFIDPTNQGFQIGTNGRAVTLDYKNVSHQGESDSGEIVLSESNFNIGNGTDAIDVNGLSYSYGFGNVNNNVTISGAIQGYGFQPSVSSSATIQPGNSVTGFYDGSTISTPSPSYTSFSASPTISNIQNNANYTGLRVNPNITSFTGNSGFDGISIGGTIGTVSQYYNGINIAPTIGTVAQNTQAVGVSISMDNVTVAPGSVSSIVFQDITYSFIVAANNNATTIQYTPGATAGSEVVTILGQAITIQIESGVSTATQVKAAIDASVVASSITATITGTASNPQTTAGPSNFTGGANPGSKLAARFDGDVQIDGTLAFNGALSVGEFNAFFSEPLVNGGGQPTSGHSLVTSPTVASNATIPLADYLGVNTAMLLNVGNNATVTTAFLGVTAMGLPAVINLGTGATIDRIGAGAFAISLDASALGGTVDIVSLCRSLALPNGTTTVNRLYGYEFDLPFGDPGTDTWAFYNTQDVPSWFRGSILVGGAAGGGNDRPVNSSVGIEIASTTKAFLNARMTTVQRDALTPINGMQIYNTTTDKLQVYAAGTWVDLH